MGDRTRRRVGMPPAGTVPERKFEPEALDYNLYPELQAQISSAISLKRIADMMERDK